MSEGAAVAVLVGVILVLTIFGFIMMDRVHADRHDPKHRG